MTLKGLKEPVWLPSINSLSDLFVWSNTSLVILLNKSLEDVVNRDLLHKSYIVLNERNLQELLKSNDLQILKQFHQTQVTTLNLLLNNEMKSKNNIWNFFENHSKNSSKKRCQTNPTRKQSQVSTNPSKEVPFQKKTPFRWKKTTSYENLKIISA